ncbi:stalk domain-containing protein [Paenibacillus contaminans]|uniref:Copper amine oxidase-like N-terminal domain-containing protein n=1 Tax=Paenibacillus contaminans TaxID=450362 RepID=A0A329LWG3_9BACL|nr:stalk domain-containing protein [Paenibacillus contaminans]RAV12169.1 hypothetical protein DQG23_35195 [Paenibacillus contaminans]
MKKFKHYTLGLLSGAILATGISVFADDGIEKIEAYLRPGLPITLDGKEFKLESPPVMYDGSTYLKLRDVAAITGLGVNWNEGTETVELQSAGKLVKDDQIKNDSGNLLTVQDMTMYMNNKTFYDKSKNHVRMEVTDEFYNSYRKLDSYDDKFIVAIKQRSQGISNHDQEMGKGVGDNATFSFSYKGRTVLEFQDLGIDNGTQDVDME